MAVLYRPVTDSGRRFITVFQINNSGASHLHYKNYVRIGGICLLAGLLCSANVQAAGGGTSFSAGKPSTKNSHHTSNRPWGNLGAYKPGLKHEQLPAMPPPGYPGAAPGAGWYPAQMPGTATTSSSSQPVVEIETSATRLYEQQSIVYTVRVVSSGNLKTLTPVIPRIDGAIMEQVDGPVASTRYSGRSSSLEIINEYHFKLTPLRSGEIVVPAMQFNGTHVPGRQWNGAPAKPARAADNRFSIAADSPLTLQALPADPSVTPWLPLNDLRLRVFLPADGPVKAGVPVTLTLIMTARGALGTQLPSLEPQLKSDNFRAYRDSVSTTNGVSLGGTQLLGSRKEIYTIIPLHDGWIEMPAIQVAWWDVDTNTPMLAGRSGLNDATSAEKGRTDVAGAQQGLSSLYIWAPLLIVMGLIVGYWVGAWARTRPLLRSAGARLSASGRRLVQHAAVAGKKLSPVIYLDKIRLGFALLMPRTIKLWLCTRCLEREDSPEEWCIQFRSRVCTHLGVSRHAPISAIAEKLIEAQPQAEPARVRALAQSMDNAIYGAGPLDFVAWKKDFRYQLRPRLYRRRRSRLRRASSVLPALNPRAA